MYGVNICVGVDRRMTLEQKEIMTKTQRVSRWGAQKIYYSIGKQHQKKWTIKRGEVYFADLGENIGSEQNKIRPVVVLQSDAYNFKSPVFTCAIISSSPLTIPDIQVPITGAYTYIDENGETKKLLGNIDLGQIKTIGKERIVNKKVCKLENEMQEIDRKIFNALGLSAIIKSKENIIKSLQGKIEYMKNKTN